MSKAKKKQRINTLMNISLEILENYHEINFELNRRKLKKRGVDFNKTSEIIKILQTKKSGLSEKSRSFFKQSQYDKNIAPDYAQVEKHYLKFSELYSDAINNKIPSKTKKQIIKEADISIDEQMIKYNKKLSKILKRNSLLYRSGFDTSPRETERPEYTPQISECFDTYLTEREDCFRNLSRKLQAAYAAFLVATSGCGFIGAGTMGAGGILCEIAAVIALFGAISVAVSDMEMCEASAYARYLLCKRLERLEN